MAGTACDPVWMVMDGTDAQDAGRDAAAPDSDEALMARVADGDAAAFDRLAARHMRRAVALAQRVTGNPSDADEVVQEAFLRVWQHAGRWEPGRASFTAWLQRIVVNLAIDRRRRPGWQPIDEALPDEAPDATVLIGEREDAARVTRELGRLNERQRLAVVLFYQEGLSLRAAAEALGIGPTAFGSLLARARQALRAALLEEKDP
ncbi:sigma-70 family RNA polymerase sigma factor [Azospirillum oleiclasticum]|nr:sigma-70 family RNA polymerase sigma factor [Azospirillum oleiclasticum]